MSKKQPCGPWWNVMCLIYLFLAGLRTSLFSLETASVLSHSNLKIEMSLLGCIAVMAATSFGLLNCAVNIYSKYIYIYIKRQRGVKYFLLYICFKLVGDLHEIMR